MKAKGFRQREFELRNGKLIIIEESYYDSVEEAQADEEMGLIDHYETVGKNIANELMDSIKQITDDYRLTHIFNKQ